MLKKNRTQSKNSNKKLTRGFLYEMVFVRNGLCMKLYVKIEVPPRTKILVRSDSYGSPLLKWSNVFVRNGP